MVDEEEERPRSNEACDTRALRKYRSRDPHHVSASLGMPPRRPELPQSLKDEIDFASHSEST